MGRFKKFVVSAIASVAVVVISACATIPAPQTLSQRIAIAEGALTGFVESAATMVVTGRISKEQGKKILDIANQADVSLSLARISLKAGNPDDALGRLRIAQQLLLEIEKMLKAVPEPVTYNDHLTTKLVAS